MRIDRKWTDRIEREVRPDGDRPWKEYVTSLITAAVPQDGKCPTIVDAGCGAQNWILHAANAAHATKIGLDIDPDAAKNPHMDRVLLASADDIPLDDAIADVVLSSYVLEHLKDPGKAFREFARILKPGGRLILWTPNLLNYAIIAAKLTPTGFHNFMRRLTNPELADNCPVYYRANTAGAIEGHIRRAGLEMDGKPVYGANAYTYWAFSKPLFYTAVLGSRLISATPLACLKSMIIAQATKPAR